MEQHPVPQNIIDVEFKLFGSFTLKQFGKMLIGSVIGVLLYFTPLIPPLIKYPAIAIVVGIGILLAIIPNFGIWLNGFLKALLISPRYVWIKEQNTPEILRRAVQKEVSQNLNVGSAKSRGKRDISEFPLDRMYATTTQQSSQDTIEEDFLGNEDTKLRTGNLTKLYDQVYANDAKPLTSNVKSEQIINVSPAVTQKIVPEIQTPAQLIAKYDEQIQNLKYQLSMLNKDANYAAKEQEILSQINDIYQEVKLLKSENSLQHSLNGTSENRVVSTDSLAEGSVIHGIVVSKLDSPLEGVKIIFSLSSGKERYSCVSQADGRFATKGFLPRGEYSISLEKSGLRFHSYKIVIGDQKLPAFKFREK